MGKSLHNQIRNLPESSFFNFVAWDEKSCFSKAFDSNLKMSGVSYHLSFVFEIECVVVKGGHSVVDELELGSAGTESVLRKVVFSWFESSIESLNV
jgi:hypothetical protein